MHLTAIPLRSIDAAGELCRCFYQYFVHTGRVKNEAITRYYDSEGVVEVVRSSYLLLALPRQPCRLS